MITLAVDPGLVTGWACLSSPGFKSGQVEGRFAFYNLFDGYGPAPWFDRVICEDFIISERTLKASRQADPHRIIGYLEGRCHALGIEFYLQTPARAKSFATNDKLAAVGWRNPTKGGHADDAARHLLTWLVSRPQEGKDLRARLAAVLL